MEKRAVIYARYSCDKQSEQSIEGQIHVINDFAVRNGYTIVSSYIDRAKSAKTANRPQFLQMISDSAKSLFDFVLVYKLDRFSRNRYDSAFYKHKLKQNGVQVISATECLSDNPESIITEAMLEAMAEFYSAELGQKTKRGMRESALKCMSTGSKPPLGYKWGADKHLEIDEATADIPRIAFSMYADGKGKQTIADELNRRGFRTRTGREFKVNSLDNMLTNPKYIGTFTYGTDISIENGCPALISHDIYDKVQELLKHTKKAPARAKAKVEYYLAGRLKCGICGESMIAVGGTSQNGTQHHYYRCKCRGKGCNKKPERKDFLEWYITEQVLALLNMEEHKERLAEKIIAAYKSGMETNKTEEYKRQIQITETKLNNVLDLLIEKKSDSLMKKLDELELRKSELEEQLRSAELAQSHIPTKREIIEWFDRLSNVDGCENSLQRQVIHTFVKEVFLWDDHAVIVLTLNNTQETITFEEIREFEQLSDETQEPLPDESESGSCKNSFGSPDWT